MSWLRLAYRRGEHLGSGSCGDVYRARLWRNGQIVAVKVLARFGDISHQLARLQAEAAALTELKHSGIVRLHGIRRHRGDRFAIVMEYVDGCSLARLLELGPLPVSAGLHVARSVLEALNYAHEHGFVHRDVSPGNILIARDGQVKLADFGLAKLVGSRATTGHHVSGTLPYLAPEQVMGCALDGRADLFAVGVLMHVMFTGQSPFSAETPTAIMAQLMSGNSPATDLLPGAVADVVTRMLQHQRNTRLANASQALNNLPPAPDGREQLASLVRARIRRPARPKRTGVWMAAAAAAGLLLGYHGNDVHDVAPAAEPTVQVQRVESSKPSSTQPATSQPTATEAPMSTQQPIPAEPKSQLKPPKRKQTRAKKRTHRKKRSVRSTPRPPVPVKAQSQKVDETTNGTSWEAQPTRGLTLEYYPSADRKSQR